MWSSGRRDVHQQDESQRNAQHHHSNNNNTPTMGVAQIRNASPVPPRQLNHWGPPPAASNSNVMTEGFVAAPRGLPPALQRRLAPTQQHQQQQPPTQSLSPFGPPPSKPPQASWQQPSPPVQPQQARSEAEHYGDYDDEDEDGGALTTTINLVASAASALFQRATAASPNNPKAPPRQAFQADVSQPALQPPAPAILSPTTSMLDSSPSNDKDTSFQHESMLQAQPVEDKPSTNSAFNTPTPAPNAFVPSPANSTTTSTPPSQTSSSGNNPLPPIVTTPRRQLPTPQPPSTHHRSFLQRPPPAIRSSPRHAKPKFKLPPPVPLSLGSKKLSGTPPTFSTPSPPVTPSMTSMSLPSPAETTPQETTQTTVTPGDTASAPPVKSAFQTAVDMEGPTTTSTSVEPAKETVAPPPAPSNNGPGPLVPPLPSTQAQAPPTTAPQGPPPPTQVTLARRTVTPPPPVAPAPWAGVPPPAAAVVPPPPTATANVGPPPPPQAATVPPPAPKPEIVAPPPALPAVLPPAAPPVVPPAAPPVAAPPPTTTLLAGPQAVLSLATPAAPPGALPEAPPPAPPTALAPPPAGPPRAIPSAPPVAPLAAVPAPPPAGPPTSFPAAPPGAPPVAFSAAPPKAFATAPPAAPPTAFPTAPPVAGVAGPPTAFPAAPSAAGPPTAFPAAPPAAGPPTAFPAAPPAGPPAYFPPVASPGVPVAPPAALSVPPIGPPILPPTGLGGPSLTTQASSIAVAQTPAPPVQDASVMPFVAPPQAYRCRPEVLPPPAVAATSLPPPTHIEPTSSNAEPVAVARSDDQYNSDGGEQDKVVVEPHLQLAPRLNAAEERPNGVTHDQPPEREIPGDEANYGAEEDEAPNPANNYEEELADGWVQEWDTDSGLPYYYNVHTQETTWEKPVSPSKDGEGNSASEDFLEQVNGSWLSSVDENENDARQEEQSKTPESTLPPATKLSEETPALPPLPDGWVEEFDESSAQPYYYNLVTQDTTWDRPAVPIEPVLEQEARTNPEAEVEQLNNADDFAEVKGVPESTWSGDELGDSPRNDGLEQTDSPPTSWDEPEAEEQTGLSYLDEQVPRAENVVSEGPVICDQPELAIQNESDAALPKGWCELLDPSSGLTYYFNVETQETSWERPEVINDGGSAKREVVATSPAKTDEVIVDSATEAERDETIKQLDQADTPLPQSAELPEGWVEEFDQSSGLPYYFNTLTNEATWDRPVLTVAEDEFPGAVLPRNPDAGEGSDGLLNTTEKECTLELPPGWVQGVDQSSGKPYYYFFDEPVLTRSWTRPSPPEIPEHLSPLFEEGEDDENTLLPDGWVENTDPSTGKKFYYFEEDKVGTSTWRRPSVKAFVPSLEVLEEELDGVAGTTAPANVLEERFDSTQDTAAEMDIDLVNGNIASVKSLETTIEKEDDGLAFTPGNGEIDILPEGWTKHLDPTSGLHYYFNALENTTTWDPPQTAEREAAADFDEINEIQPEETQSQEAQEAICTDTTHTGISNRVDDILQSEAKDVIDELPEGWEALIDEPSGLTYYFNVLDNISTWEKPTKEQPLDGPTGLQEEGESLQTGESPEDEVYPQKQNGETLAGSVTEEDEAPGGSNVLDLNEVGVSSSQNPELEVEKITSENEPSEGTEDKDAASPLLGSLPQGWVELTDADSGLKYYVFEADGTAVWERPVSLITGDGSGVPEAVQGEEPTTDASENLESEATAVDGLAQGESQDPTEEQVNTEESGGNLPPGWVELIDEASGNPYYFHDADNIAVWERPSGHEASSDAFPAVAEPLESVDMPVTPKSLSENQQAIFDGSTGSEGAEFDAIDASPVGESENRSGDGGETTAEVDDDYYSLPEGWVELTDPVSGKPYYFNEAENVTTWERPPKESVILESDAKQGELVSAVQRDLGDTSLTDGQHQEDETSYDQVVPLSEGWVEVTDPSYAGEIITSAENQASSEDSTTKVSVVDASIDANEDIHELPRGWIQLIDPGSGNPFYFNESDKTTTWERPVTQVGRPPADSVIMESQHDVTSTPEDVMPEEQLSAPDALHERGTETSVPRAKTLPDGWVEVIDEASGLPYYLNQELNITTWDRPAFVEGTEDGKRIALPDTSSFEKEEPATVDRDFTNDLPAGWAELADPSTGQVFYFNEKENLSTWVRPGLKESAKAEHLDGSMKRLVSHSFASFGFAGKLCTWNYKHGRIVALHNSNDFAPFDDIANVERAKRQYGLDGPLNACEESVVMEYIEGRVKEKPDDLLWSLILIAAKSMGKLRSEELKGSTDGPEAAIVNLLLRDGDSVGVGSNGSSAVGSQEVTNGSRHSIEKVQSLLLRGKREDAVQEALASHNYAVALLVSAMCDQELYHRAVKEFADHALTVGSPLHTLSLMLSKQLQPLAERALDGSETNSSIWGTDADLLRSTWKHHLAAIISNKRAGWDKIILTLGDRLLELGDVKDAHFCYMVCGSPLSSPSNPSTRMAIVGCDHLVPMDIALMTTEGIDAYERSEAFEWAKRRGNRNAAIQSLQPFKLIYASLLCDLGLKSTSERYLQSIRICAGLSEAEHRGKCIPSPFASFSDRASLSHAVDSIEARLRLRPATGAKSKTGPPETQISHTEGLPSNVPSTPSSHAISYDLAVPNDDEMTFVSAKSNLPDITIQSPFNERKGLSENEVGAYQTSGFVPGREKPDELRASGNALESISLKKSEKSTSASSDKGKSSTATKSSARSPRGTLRTRKVAGESKKSLSEGKKSVPGNREKKSNFAESSNPQPVTEGGPPLVPPQQRATPVGGTSVAPPIAYNHVPSDQSALPAVQAEAPLNSVVGPPKVATTERQEQPPTMTAALATPVSAPLPGRKEPPKTAPAVMSAADNKNSSKPPAAPSSEKKGRSWGLGIKEKMTKWLNPDAKTADLGEGMQAYYDEQRKVWVFPGEDPDEKVKPIAPPPIMTSLGPEASAPTQPETPQSNDPLAAMMAPPKRTPASLPRGMGSRPTASRQPNFSPAAGAGSGPPPQFAVFQPKPASS